MYELFLLGKLMDRPWHGYEFHQVLNAFVGPMRQVSWGTIYPLFRRLESEGLIKPASGGSASADKRGRQSYAITLAGKRTFHERMQPESLNDANYRDTFRVMLGNFSRVDSATRRTIVKGYLERLAAVIAHAERMAARVRSVSELKETEREDILLALERDRALAEADRRWIREKMAGG
jgi:DNA-binding PadR family transcriptional regulator